MAAILSRPQYIHYCRNRSICWGWCWNYNTVCYNHFWYLGRNSYQSFTSHGLFIVMLISIHNSYAIVRIVSYKYTDHSENEAASTRESTLHRRYMSDITSQITGCEQQLDQARNKDNLKTPLCWPFMRSIHRRPVDSFRRGPGIYFHNMTSSWVSRQTSEKNSNNPAWQQR